MSTDTLSASLPPNSATAAPPGGGVGLGYGIVIAVGILVLVSTIMLASYICVRVKCGAGHHRLHSRSRSRPAPTTFTTNSIPVSVGLDEPTIESFTKFFYGAAGHARPVTGPCPICLAEYREGEPMRCMPECEHCFHSGCVDEWLRVSATCPLCRSSPVPSAATTPVATPLSELIPLAVLAR